MFGIVDDSWFTSWTFWAFVFLGVWGLLVLATLLFVRGASFDPNDPRTKHLPPENGNGGYWPPRT